MLCVAIGTNRFAASYPRDSHEGTWRRLKNSTYWLMARVHIDFRPIGKWKYPVGAYSVSGFRAILKTERGRCENKINRYLYYTPLYAARKHCSFGSSIGK